MAVLCIFQEISVVIQNSILRVFLQTICLLFFRKLREYSESNTSENISEYFRIIFKKMLYVAHNIFSFKIDFQKDKWWNESKIKLNTLRALFPKLLTPGLQLFNYELCITLILLVGINKFNQSFSGLHNLRINPGVKKLLNKALNVVKFICHIVKIM